MAMKVFDGDLLKEAITDHGLSEDEFILECLKKAPLDMKPNRAYIKRFIDNLLVPGTKYLTLFAWILDCPIDCFFAPRPKRKKGVTNGA